MKWLATIEGLDEQTSPFKIVLKCRTRHEALERGKLIALAEKCTEFMLSNINEGVLSKEVIYCKELT